MGRLTHTVSGSIATVRSPAVAPIESLKVHFSPIQEGTGDPSPSNVRPITGWTGVTGYKSGKNLFDISKFKEKDGITVNGDSMTGTAVAFREAYNVSNGELYPLYIPAGSKVAIQFTSNCDGGNTVGAGFSINLYYSTDSDDSVRAFYTSNSETTPTYHSGTITLAKDVVGLAFVYYNNALANTWTVSDIQIEIGASATEYEPYKGYDAMPGSFPNFSTNLFDSTDETFVNMSKSNGIYSNSDVDSRTYAQFEIQLYNNTTLLSTLSPHNFTGTGLMSFDFNVNNSLCNLICFKHNGVTKDFRIRFPFTYGNGIYTISCNIISNDPTTVGGLQLSDISIKRGNENVIDYVNNKVYSGYVDLVTGEIFSERVCLKTTWGNYQYTNDLTNTTRRRFVVNGQIKSASYVNDNNRIKRQVWCNLANWRWDWNGDNVHFYSEYESNASYAYLFLPVGTSEDTEIQFVLTYETPQLIATLTPQELATFKGYSNFWSNAGDVDVTYQVVESSEMTKERQKIFAGNAPSIHTISGSIANFEMEPGLNRNLKSCKIGFLPVQEGSGDPFPPINQNGSIVGVNNTHNESELSSFKIHFSPIQSGTGDPSPSNIRPITGWTGVTGYKGGKNLYSAGDQTFTQSRRVQIGQMIKPGTYTLSLEATSDDIDDSTCLVYLYNGAEGTSMNKRFERNTRNSWTFTSDVEFDCLYLYASKRWVDGEGDTATFSNIQLEVGSVATSYEAYSAPTSYPVSWESQGTVYGGYVDLVSGEVWKTYDAIDLGSISWTYYKYGNYNGGYNDLFQKNLKKYTANELPNAYCTHLFMCTDDAFNTNTADHNITINIFGMIKVTYNEATSAEHLKSLLSGVLLVAELETPELVTTLTPTQIQALKGTNNILSDANGIIEVKYWSH